MKVLILKPSSLGDVIHAIPVLRLIKIQRPKWTIHWWIAKNFAPLLEMDRDIGALHYFDRGAWNSFSGIARGISSLEGMKAEKYDLVIDLQGLARSALHGWAVGGGYTVGLDQRREGASLFYDASVPRPSLHAHAVDWYLQVLTELGLSVEGSYEWLPERPWVAEGLGNLGYQPKYRWIALCPGARWESKRWPVESFEELIKRIDLPDVRFVVIGGKDDQAIGKRLGRLDSTLDLTGRTSLPEMIEWMRVCSTVVTNDTGPMHIAAALGVRVLALFGPTDSRKTGPYSSNSKVLRQVYGQCDQCVRGRSYRVKGHNCMESITPDVVVSEVNACE